MSDDQNKPKDDAEKAAAEKAAAEKAAAEKPAKDAKPKWQADDYTGPLTSGQAEWRQRHIKPAKAKTK